MIEECLGTDSSIVILYTQLLVLLGQTLVLSSCIHSCLFYWVVSLCTHFVAFKTDPEMQRLQAILYCSISIFRFLLSSPKSKVQVIYNSIIRFKFNFNDLLPKLERKSHINEEHLVSNKESLQLIFRIKIILTMTVLEVE